MAPVLGGVRLLGPVRDGNLHAVHGVVQIAAVIPFREKGLPVAGGIGGPTTQLVVSGSGLPSVAPLLPRAGASGLELCHGPATAAVGAHFNRFDRREA